MTQPITPLRQRMLDDMKLRNMAVSTRKIYVSSVAGFSAYHGRSPDQLTLEDVRDYQLHLVAGLDKSVTAHSLRHSSATRPARAGRRHPGDPALAGSSADHLDHALRPGCAAHDPAGEAPARAARPRRTATGLSRWHDPAAARGGGHLPPLRARLARRQRGAPQPRPAARHARGRALPYGGAGRPRRAMRRLCPHPHRLQLLPQPPLSQVPVDGGPGLARGARGRAPAGALLPRRVHPAGGARRPGLPEQGQGLRTAAQDRGRDPDHDRRRSQAPRGAGSASSPCCTAGVRPSTTIRTSTASCRPAASP